MRALAGVLPWFLPGMLGAAIAALAFAGRVARRLQTTRWNAVLLVTSAGAVVAATIPPAGDGDVRDVPAAAGRCDLGRLVLAPLADYVHVGDTGLNVVLFVPLGLATGLLCRTRAGVWVLVATAVSPVVIEATQALAPVLGRGCQSQDVVDNLLGLGIGVALAGAVRGIRAGRSPTRAADHG